MFLDSEKFISDKCQNELNAMLQSLCQNIEGNWNIIYPPGVVSVYILYTNNVIYGNY